VIFYFVLFWVIWAWKSKKNLSSYKSWVSSFKLEVSRVRSWIFLPNSLLLWSKCHFSLVYWFFLFAQRLYNPTRTPMQNCRGFSTSSCDCTRYPIFWASHRLPGTFRQKCGYYICLFSIFVLGGVIGTSKKIGSVPLKWVIRTKGLESSCRLVFVLWSNCYFRVLYCLFLFTQLLFTHLTIPYPKLAGSWPFVTQCKVKPYFMVIHYFVAHIGYPIAFPRIFYSRWFLYFFS
jgi:hypothetical protein